jgi:ketosteroid isomerase-like protein
MDRQTPGAWRAMNGFLGSIEDRLAIHELASSYADAICRKDVDAWDATWADDAVWAFGDREIADRDMRRAMLSGILSGIEEISFVCFVGAMSVSGDQAQARVHTREWIQPKGGSLQRAAGKYEDALVKQNGVWRYARRQYTSSNFDK